MNALSPSFFHIPTAFLTVGFLFMLVPVAAWLMLKERGSSAPTIWFIGGLVMGLGLTLFGFRPSAPLWLSYFAGNSLLVVGNILHVHALRQEVGQRSSWAILVLVYALVMVPHEYFRLVLDSAYLRFTWSLGCLTVALAWTAWLARTIALREGSKSAHWLAGVYVVLAALMALRVVRAMLGLTPPEALATGMESVLDMMGMLVVAVLGNVAILGLYLERLGRQNLDLARTQERQVLADQLNQKIAASERERSLGEMSAALAHELGQPITGILMDFSAVKSECEPVLPGNPMLSESLESLEDHAMRARKIIDSIRRFYLPGEAQTAAVDVRSVVEDVMYLLKAAVREQRVRFEVQPSQPLPRVNANAVLLSQVFLNLFRNAIEAHETSRPVHLRIAFRHQGEQLQVLVDDDGPTLSEQALARIGKPFFSTKSDGMGMGLVICRRIIEQYGGSLRLRPSDTLSGLQVEICLPISART